MTEDMIADKSSYVDLELSVKWATCNLGANAPEEFGDYYAWGETRPKETFTDENYKYETGMFYSKYNLMDRLITLEPHDDAAVVARAYPWRIPTVFEMSELLFNCKWEWTTLNGVKGNKVTGPNGNSLFLPAAGFRTDKFFDDKSANYLTSMVNPGYLFSYAYTLGFWDEHTHITSQPRSYGFSVRPVFK